MIAETIQFLVQAVSRNHFPDNATKMEPHVWQWFEGVTEYRDAGSHKYIPTKKLNEKFGLPQGAGIYNYVSFKDNSYLLLTCNNGVLVWDANAEPV